MRCLDSILEQTLEDLEVVVSDNASTDGTCEIVEQYAQRDSRVRLVRQPENLGIIENFNYVARLARGDFFRWIGADDWLEPTYLAECVAALDADPDAVVVTTYFDLNDEHGNRAYEEYQGEFLESPRPERRLERMLWFFHAGPALYDPNYSVIRREVLERTDLLQMERKSDWIFAVQLTLAGRFHHVRKLLFHRSWPLEEHMELETHLRRLHPSRHQELSPSVLRLIRALRASVAAAPLRPEERLRCHAHLLRFGTRQWLRDSRRGIQRFRRETLGLTRSRFR